MLKLKYYPNEVLRKPTKKIKKFDKTLKVLADDMRDLMHKENGIGLAAPQIGLSIKLIIVGDGIKSYAMCNPEIVSKSGTQTGLEGCLSFKGLWKEIERPKVVTVKYHDINGKMQILKAEDLLARCIVHEKSHLDGVLFIDEDPQPL